MEGKHATGDKNGQQSATENCCCFFVSDQGNLDFVTGDKMANNPTWKLEPWYGLEAFTFSQLNLVWCFARGDKKGNSRPCGKVLSFFFFFFCWLHSVVLRWSIVGLFVKLSAAAPFRSQSVKKLCTSTLATPGGPRYDKMHNNNNNNNTSHQPPLLAEAPPESVWMVDCFAESSCWLFQSESKHERRAGRQAGRQGAAASAAPFRTCDKLPEAGRKQLPFWLSCLQNESNLRFIYFFFCQRDDSCEAVYWYSF